MSYCPIDEAFETPFNYQKCVKRNKTKRNKINCNEKYNRFSKNRKDMEVSQNLIHPKKKTYNSNNNSENLQPHPIS